MGNRQEWDAYTLGVLRIGKCKDVMGMGAFCHVLLVYHLMIDGLVVPLFRYAKHGVLGHPFLEERAVHNMSSGNLIQLSQHNGLGIKTEL